MVDVIDLAAAAAGDWFWAFAKFWAGEPWQIATAATLNQKESRFMTIVPQASTEASASLFFVDGQNSSNPGIGQTSQARLRPYLLTHCR